ncbi:MAG: TetR/AcrR family transcriptional regulator [Acidimicrobiales bacterium]|nr:TetR/AcrR family transcriptional regulator [Acidimicrobiales bacterium]
MEEINSSRRAPFGANPVVGDAGRATQQRILTAAAEVFASEGYARTSVEAITDKAGCSRPTFYQYFSGKEDLHRRLAARLGTELAALVDDLGPVDAGREGRDALVVWLTGLAATYDRYRAVTDSFSASVRTDDRMVRGAATLSDRYRSTLADAIVGTPAAGVDVPAVAAVVNSVAFGACTFRQRMGGVSPERLTDALADAVHRSFFGPLEGINVGARKRSRIPKRPPPLTTQTPELPPRRGLQTRARLLTAATIAFATLGYDAVRVDDIAREAGVSHGSFYRYFADKEAIYAEHLLAAIAEVVDLVDELPTAHPHQWMDRYFEMYSRAGGILSNLPEAYAAGVRGAIEARGAGAAALARALGRRSFGDTDADIYIAFALLDVVPATAFRRGAAASESTLHAAARVLDRGLFGRTG